MQIKFQDGNPLKKVNNANYSGGIIDVNCDATIEIKYNCTAYRNTTPLDPDEQEEFLTAGTQGIVMEIFTNDTILIEIANKESDLFKI